jgi:hypothetical protein
LQKKNSFSHREIFEEKKWNPPHIPFHQRPSEISTEISKFYDQLEHTLDPIDAAYYSPHIKTVSSRYVKRSGVLFGLLGVNISRAAPETRYKKFSEISSHNCSSLQSLIQTPYL